MLPVSGLFLLHISASHGSNPSVNDSLDQAGTLHYDDHLDQVEEDDKVAKHCHHLEGSEECLTEVIRINACIGWQFNALRFSI